MPKYIELWNQHIEVEKATEIDQAATKANGGTPVVVEVWKIIFADRQLADQHVISIRKEARDDLVRKLTGGVVLAGGDLPSV